METNLEWLLVSAYFNPYSQIFVGGGASGSGMYIGGDNYIATWTAGASNNTRKELHKVMLMTIETLTFSELIEIMKIL